jgi:glyoxylase-like metal-dependent hydrolase (beta-lactamase superfamily II)
VLHTPGHTPDTASCMLRARVFCGDLIFRAAWAHGPAGGTRSSAEHTYQGIHSAGCDAVALGARAGDHCGT